MVLSGLVALAESDVVSLPDETVLVELRALMAAANLLQAALWARISSFDTRGLSEVDGLRTTRAWLSAVGRLSPHAASQLVRQATTLRQLPALTEATRSGTVTTEHVAAITALAKQIGVDAVRTVDPVLAELAQAGTPAQLHQACKRVRDHADPDGPLPDPATERRDLSIARVGDMVHLRGQLDPEAGALLVTTLDALIRPPQPDDPRTPGQRRADALIELARLPLHAGALPMVAGGRPHIALLVTPDQLASLEKPTMVTRAPDPLTPTNLSAGVQAEPVVAHIGRPTATAAAMTGDPLTASGIHAPPEPPRLSWGGPIEPATAQRLACDSVLYRILYDPLSGQPLDVGREHRTAPPAIRRALHARDHGCRWPGCDSPVPWCDAHHLVPWSQGGATSIDSMLLLCRYHHTLVHEGQWHLAYHAVTGEVCITRPDGGPYELGRSKSWLSHRAA